MGLEITDYEAFDHEMLDDLIPEGIQVNKIIADGGYYSIEKEKGFIAKALFLLLFPLLMLLYTESQQQVGMIRPCNTLKIREVFMLFIKNTIITADRLLKHKYHGSKDV